MDEGERGCRGGPGGGVGAGSRSGQAGAANLPDGNVATRGSNVKPPSPSEREFVQVMTRSMRSRRRCLEAHARGVAEANGGGDQRRRRSEPWRKSGGDWPGDVPED